MKRDETYFIGKFLPIADENWCEGDLHSPYRQGTCCALGHCGVVEENYKYIYTDESYDLISIFKNLSNKNGVVENREHYYITKINDSKYIRSEPTPKERIVCRLIESLIDKKHENISCK